MKAKNLKLLAKTEEDLKVVSAHLQDSIANISDIANLTKNRMFLLQLNRFMWEDVEKGVFRKNKRIRTILKFDNVLEVKSKNINQNKKNTFLDFISCAEYLCKNNYTSKGKIIAQGGSAGGLLMGYISNERPDLFLGIIAQVPFVDICNTMLDEDLPLTVTEIPEWGDMKNDQEAFKYIKSYAPYDLSLIHI